MRRLRLGFLIFITFFAVSTIHSAAAQNGVDVTIYRDADSLTIFTPGIPLHDLALEITLPNGWKVTHALLDFPAFDGVQVAGTTCFHIIHEGSSTPPPSDCQNAEMLVQEVANDDPFWEDMAGEFSVVNSASDEIYGICAADSARCTATVMFQMEFPPTCEGHAGNNEALVVIAQFEKSEDSPISPESKWEEIFNNAIPQVRKEVDARVLHVPQIVTTKEAALRLSNCYIAAFVIWGSVTDENVESHITENGQWSGSPFVPDYLSLTTLLVQPIDDFESGDDDYLQNFVHVALLFAVDEIANTLPILEQAIAQVPQGREQEMALATLYMYMGFYHGVFEDRDAEAIEALTQALAIDATSEHAAYTYELRGLAYDNQNNLERAIADYNEAIRLSPQYGEAYFRRGVSYHQLKQYTLAIADYTQAIHINPNSSRAYYNRGSAYDSLEEYALAIDDYTAAIRINPEFTDVYYSRGNAYREQLKDELAIPDFTQAIRLDPKNTDAYYGRGSAYREVGDYDLALADFNEAIRLDPGYARAYAGRGLTYYYQGKIKLALADFNESLRLDPEDSFALNSRGTLYFDQQNFTDAIADFSAAIRLDPEYITAYFYRGTAYLSVEEYKLAIADFDTVIAYNPNIGNAYYKRAFAHQALGEFELAIADFTRAIELKDSFIVDALLGRGRSYMAREEYELAIADFNQILALQPDYINAYAYLGFSYEGMKNLDEALIQLHHYIELAGDDADSFVVTHIRELEAGIPTPTPTP